MTRRDRWTVGMVALICGFVGPALAVTLFWWLPLALASVVDIGRPSEGFGLVTGWLVAYWIIAIIDFGIQTAVLAALGAWLLLRQREPGYQARNFQLAGTVYGAVCGAGVLAFHYVVTPLFSERMNVRFSSDLIWFLIERTAAASITGLIIGFFISRRLHRSVTVKP
jgi:predicted membrane protein